MRVENTLRIFDTDALFRHTSTKVKYHLTHDESAHPMTNDPNDTPVLMIVDGESLNREQMMAYTKALLSSGLYDTLGGYYLNSARPIDTFEGETPDNHVTLVVRFPSLKSARTFWYSRTYQDTIKPLRLDPVAGNFTVRVYREVDVGAHMAGKVGSNAFMTSFETTGVAVQDR